MGEEIIIQDENGKKYSILRVLDADTKKIIDDLSALVVKKDKIIDEILKAWKQDDVRSIAELKDGQIDFWISDKEIEERIRNKFVSKDKIKEILGIEEDIDSEKLLSLLQTIVDENARLEDIEDRKVQIEYNNVFNKGVKSVEDKIKAKIEEYKKQIEKMEKDDIGRGFTLGKEWSDLKAKVEFGQSLLEKE